MPSAPQSRQPPVDPPYPIGVFEAYFSRFPPHGEHLLVPRSPHPSRLYPLGEPLWLGHVPLHVAGCSPPVPHLFYPSTRLQMTLADLSTDLVPGTGHETT